MHNSKFLPLVHYLKFHNNSDVCLSFSEIEGILEFPLCASAYKYRPYWYPSPTHSLPLLLESNGFKITDVDLMQKKIWIKCV